MGHPTPETDKKAAVRFLKRYSSAGARPLRWSTLCSLAGGALVIASAFLLARLVDAAVFHPAHWAQVAPLLAALAGVYALRAALLGIAEYYGNRAASQVKQSLRGLLVGRVLAPGTTTQHISSGEAMTMIAEGLEALHGYYARYLPTKTVSAFLPLLLLCVIFPLNSTAALVLMVTGPLIPVFMILIGEGTERLNQKQWRVLSLLGGYCFDRIQGLTTLKLFGTSGREAESIARMGERYRHETIQVLRVAFLSSAALEFFATISIALVAVLIGFRLLWGQVDFRSAYLVLLLAPEFFLPLRRLGTHYHARLEAIGAVDMLAAWLEEKEAPLAYQPAPFTACRIVFDDVTAGYGDEPVLLHAQCDIAAGEKIALVGASGSGKTTMLSLLLGLAMPREGRILIDGVDLAQIDRELWWGSIGWVPQQAHLFWGDVRSNIRLGAHACSDEVLAQLAAELGITYLDQPVGERGLGLSAGQVQRVAIARALIRPVPLLLLDEATAGLDEEAERDVLAAIHRASRGATLIMAAHRPHAVQACSRALVVEGGALLSRPIGTVPPHVQEVA